MRSRETTVWCLRGLVDDTRCQLRHDREGVFVELRMGDELILEESHCNRRVAMARAGALRRRLLQRGWLERRPSS